MSERKPKLLVTGGLGFIGSRLIKQLVKQNEYEVNVVERYVTGRYANLGRMVETHFVDLRDSSLLKTVLRHVQPEVVMHLAAISPVTYSYDHPQEVLENNLTGTVNLAEACRETIPTFKHFIYAGTTEEYGVTPERPADEKSECIPNSPYAVSKYAGTKYLQYMNLAYDFPATIMRCTNCYSDDTLVLTETGWKYHSDWNGERIVVYDPQKDTMKLEKPLDFVQMRHTGKMIHFKSDSTDVLVTPNHRMLISVRHTNPHFQVTEAQQLFNLSEWIMKVSANWSGVETISPWQIPSHSRWGSETVSIDLKKLMLFLGYYLSEGSLSPNGHIVSIAQYHNSKYLSEMEQLFEALPLAHSSRTETRFRFGKLAPMTEFIFGGLAFHDWIDALCGHGAYGKRISPLLKHFPAEYLEPMFQAMMQGDGSWNGTMNSGCYFTVSKQLAYDFAEIAMKLGYAFKIRSYMQNNPLSKGLLYRVGICKRDTRYFNKRKRTTRMQEVDYDGNVFCFQTSTGFYVTMRNGLPAIQGNTYGRTNDTHFFIEKIISQMILKPKGEVLLGEDDAIREFMYVDDHVNAYLSVLHQRDKSGGEIFNFSTGKPMKLNEVLKSIAKLTGFEGEFVKHSMPKRPLDILDHRLNSEKARARLGWSPTVSLEEGLKRTIVILKK